MSHSEIGTTAPPTTIPAALARLAGTHNKGFTFLDSKLRPEVWSFARVAEEVDRWCRFFLAHGLKKGDRLAMIVPDNRNFVLSFLGAISAGILPVPLYPPIMGDRLNSYLETLSGILQHAQPRFLLTGAMLAPQARGLTAGFPHLEGVLSVEDIQHWTDPDPARQPPPVTPTDPCFLQFTSGSTAKPKGVVISHANLIANARAIGHGLRLQPDADRGVSWLPLFHDMGLIGFVITPLLFAVDVVFIPTMAFIRRATVWMETISRYGGTITFAPNFAFGLAAKRIRNPERLDLKQLRVVGCGAEPINGETLRHFYQTHRRTGLAANALTPCYGMAEATLAVTFADVEQPFRAVTVDREAYEEELVVRAPAGHDEDRDGLQLVSCGKTFPGHQVAIVDPDGNHLEVGRVGEILFRGPSVTRGYFGDRAASDELIRNGWLHTGDLGFLHNGELFVSGRKKDLIIINGRNYFPQAIEWEVENVEGIRRGNTVAFGVQGNDTESLVIVSEAKGGDRGAVAARVRQRISDAFGIVPADVALWDRGKLPKTTSGKIQRRRTRALYINLRRQRAAA
ncbi:MAG: fatty acyl-AMP ligase [Proteobacteria bacterium]|nr:fatty acyl-AMP ligase [Pseudomonadota bacterium]